MADTTQGTVQLSSKLAAQILVDPSRRDVMEDLYRHALQLEKQVQDLQVEKGMLASELTATKLHRDQLFGIVSAAARSGTGG